MNIIVTAQVTYEIYDVKDITEAIDVYKECVKKRTVSDTQYIGIKELFATEMSDEGTFLTHPEIWEIEEVE